MANADAPMGLKPLRHKSGAPYNGATNMYYVPATYATDLFIGDPVVKTGTANTAQVKRISGDFDVATLPEVNKATVGATNRITGVIVGFAPLTRDTPVYGAASTERVALVVDDPDVVFEAQADGAMAATTMGANANLVFTESGSTITGISGVEVDASTSAVGATLQVRVLRTVNRVDNQPNLIHQNVEVMINLHTEAVGVGSAGL